jgi:hypothetical protein
MDNVSRELWFPLKDSPVNIFDKIDGDNRYILSEFKAIAKISTQTKLPMNVPHVNNIKLPV